MLKITIPKRTTRVEIKLQRLRKDWDRGIMNGTKLAGRTIQRRATTLLGTGSRTGVHYRGLPHRSSAEGEYPRSQSGRLMRSIYYSATGTDSFRVGATEKHANFLEHGTRIMKARPNPFNPWLRKAMGDEERNVTEYLKNGVLKELKR